MSTTVRHLVIDESLSNRIVTELRKRGRPTTALSELGLRSIDDDDVLLGIAAHFGDQPWVIVTRDDNMPRQHAPMFKQLGVTAATIDPRFDHVKIGLDQEQMNRETVHRWAHLMATLSAGEVRRFNPLGHRRWTVRKS